VLHINDNNGKKCGVIARCQQAAVTQNTGYWNNERARAGQTRDAARILAKKSMMPEGEIARARLLRMKMSKENKARAKVQIAGISMKYKAVKSSMLAGSLDKAAFEKAHALTARQVASYRE